MATISPGASGNFSATGTWTGGVVPTSTDDVAMNNAFAVTLDQDITVKSITFSSTGNMILPAAMTGSRTITTTNGITCTSAASNGNGLLYNHLNSNQGTWTINSAITVNSGCSSDIIKSDSGTSLFLAINGAITHNGTGTVIGGHNVMSVTGAVINNSTGQVSYTNIVTITQIGDVTNNSTGIAHRANGGSITIDGEMIDTNLFGSVVSLSSAFTVTQKRQGTYTITSAVGYSANKWNINMAGAVFNVNAGGSLAIIKGAGTITTTSAVINRNVTTAQIVQVGTSISVVGSTGGGLIFLPGMNGGME